MNNIQTARKDSNQPPLGNSNIPTPLSKQRKQFRIVSGKLSKRGLGQIVSQNVLQRNLESQLTLDPAEERMLQ